MRLTVINCIMLGAEGEKKKKKGVKQRKLLPSSFHISEGSW